MRDVFLFCCYTGLSYTGVEKLNFNHISVDTAGRDSQNGEISAVESSVIGPALRTIFGQTG